jgi:tetratricopeptide (TPR) repeat protein
MACYDAALGFAPDDAGLANDIGRLAYRMGRLEVAEALFRIVAAKPEGFHEGANNLASALRDQMRYDEATEVLRAALQTQPDNAELWNTLGSVLTEQGDADVGASLFEEALRLDPRLAAARYNLANARLALGDARSALEEVETALSGAASELERARMRFARSTILLAAGRIAEGWDAYASRLDANHPDAPFYLINRPGWTRKADLEGRTLLLIGEQGLGDEVLFANVLPEVIAALGPGGKLWLAVEPRLVPLFQRSFPTAMVTGHMTSITNGRGIRAIPALPPDTGFIDLWAPLGCPLERFRRSLDSFPDRRAFLIPDPQRVAHWRQVLDAHTSGRPIGVLWKSLKLNSARSRFFSPFDAWAPVLQTPGATLVNLQYGDCVGELAHARDRFGVQLWTPPGIDLKNDLDDLAALCSALDLVIGPPNATTNLAAASGVPTWIIAVPGAWPLLGTDRYPWYPSVRVFQPPAFNQWEPVMQQIAAALTAPG